MKNDWDFDSLRKNSDWGSYYDTLRAPFPYEQIHPMEKIFRQFFAMIIREMTEADLKRIYWDDPRIINAIKEILILQALER